jgi:S1-C subfamily serine protease
MNLEHLNTTQIILLTLLVSFVTSIATGIVTVTLLDQAPPGVTYTISKVVERTVEKVVPTKNQGASVVKTVIIKEDNLISKAVEKNKRSLVEISLAIKSTDIKGEGTVDEKKIGEGKTQKDNKFVSTGFIASSDGLIITDSALVTNNGEYKAKIYNGDLLDVKVLSQDEDKGIAILKIISNASSTEKSTKEAQTFPPVVFADSDGVKLGQTIVLLSGMDDTDTVVLTGIISSFGFGSYEKEVVSDDTEDKNKKTEEIKYRSSISTNLSIPKESSGSVSLNTDGRVVGMNIVHNSKSYTVPSNLIVSMIKSLTETKSTSVDKPKTS